MGGRRGSAPSIPLDLRLCLRRPQTAGACARTVGASPVAKVTQVSVGSAVKGYGGEGDTDPLPMAIAACPAAGGTSTSIKVARVMPS